MSVAKTDKDNKTFNQKNERPITALSFA
jgi:hypothetical protein